MRYLWRLLILLGILAAPVGAWAVEATLHNAATANGDGGNISVADRGSVGLRVTGSGTFTVTFKGSTDGGTTFGNIYCTALASTTNVSSTTSTNQYTCPTGGLTHIQAPISGCSGCTVTVRANTSLASLGGAGGGGGGGGEVTNAGTFPVQVDGAALTSLQLLDNIVATEDAQHSDGEGLVKLGCRRKDTAASSAGTDGDWATFDCTSTGAARVHIESTSVGANTADEDGTVASGKTGDSEVIAKEYRHDGTDWKRAGYDPCQGPKTFTAINISSATTTELTASLAGASTNYYVCSITLVAAAAQTAALVDDDTDNCASVTSGLAGGTSAATGWSFAANGGIAFGNGQGTVFKTNGANRVLCLVTGQAAQISGSISYVAAP